MATSHKYNYTSNKWSYGAELELVDWPRREPLWEGMAVDDGNYTSVNSNGVAVDGKGKSYHLGGEILTAPSESVDGPAEQFAMIKHRWPEMTHNYRTGLNVHVRVPGLSSDLKKLKQLQAFVHRVMPELLPIIDPIPEPVIWATSGERKCYKTRLKDHHTLLTPERLELQLAAHTITEFFESEAVHLATGRVHWALHARTCVNLRQMLQTDTIEFRHFFMPDTPEVLLNTTLWCRMFLEAAFDGSDVPVNNLLDNFGFTSDMPWPRPLPYDPWLDEGFYYTSPHEHDREEIPARIEQWLADQKETIDARNNGLKKQALSRAGS